jgi:hypothetical protein
MRAKTPNGLLILLAVLGASASFGACADALHLDPASTKGTGGSIVVHTDAGADAPPPVACRSNPDCAYPKPVCDAVGQVCVECLVISDCLGKPGTVCSKGACSCTDMTLSYCTGETPACVDLTSSPSNCGACGNQCFGTCTASKCGNSWSPITTMNAPEARSHHVAVWTGTKMFVWGGKDGATALASGGLYDPIAKTWTPTSMANAPVARWDATAVWDDIDNVVVVWGGTTGAAMGFRQDGGRYDPAKDAWMPINTAGAPSGRTGHSAVWVHTLQGFTGSQSGMVVWGGVGTGSPGYLGDGAVYDATHDMWAGAVDSSSAPSARAFHVGVWDPTNTRMIIYGGEGSAGSPAMNVALGDVTQWVTSSTGNTWNALVAGAPSKRYAATGVWDPTSMSTIVWGGYDGTNFPQDGAVLSGTTWTALGSGGSLPEGRTGNSAVVVTPASKKPQLIIFGGDQGASTILDKGWSLDIQGNTWTALPTPGPSPRTHHTAVANGAMMIVWGGDTPSGPVNTGATYTAM